MAEAFESLQIHIIISFLLIILPIIYFIFNYLKSQNPPLPPGPTPWPILGNLYQMHNMTHVTLTNLSKTYGPLMSFKLGTQRLVVGSSSNVALEILKTYDRILSARTVPQAVQLTRSEINELSFWADPWIEQWKNIRAICRNQLFPSRAMDSQARLWEDKIMKMVKCLREQEGNVVNVDELVFAIVVNIFSNVYFSRDFISLEENSANKHMRGLITGIIQAIGSPNISDFYPLLGKLDLQGWRKQHKKMSLEMHKLWEPIVKERRERAKTGYVNQDFLDTLIDRGFTDAQINKLIEELFQAGIDTTTSTINRTMLELLNRPESMKKLQHELDTELNGQDFLATYQSVQLPYLQACVKETLRLHPPAPLLLSHRAHDTCQVLNYTIPKNARVIVNVWAIGRDPMMWDEPLEYRPERFFNSNIDFKGSDFQFLPFGAGRRICPGLPMAAKVVPLAIASLIRFLDWSLPFGNDPVMNDKFRATSQMVQPFLLIPTARK